MTSGPKGHWFCFSYVRAEAHTLQKLSSHVPFRGLRGSTKVAVILAIFQEFTPQTRYTSTHPPIGSDCTPWGFYLVTVSWSCRCFVRSAFSRFLVPWPYVGPDRQICRKPCKRSPVPS